MINAKTHLSVTFKEKSLGGTQDFATAQVPNVLNFTDLQLYQKCFSGTALLVLCTGHNDWFNFLPKVVQCNVESIIWAEVTFQHGFNPSLHIDVFVAMCIQCFVYLKISPSPAPSFLHS